jgi:hypothetical protein
MESHERWIACSFGASGKGGEGVDDLDAGGAVIE